MLVKARKMGIERVSQKNFKTKNLKENYYYLTILRDGFRVLINKEGIFLPNGTELTSEYLKSYFADIIDMAEINNISFDGVVLNKNVTGVKLLEMFKRGKEKHQELFFYAYDLISNKKMTYTERVAELRNFSMESYVPMGQQIYQKSFLKDRIKVFFDAGIMGVLVQSVYGQYNNMRTCLAVVNK